MSESEIQAIKEREAVFREAIAAARCLLWEARVKRMADGNFAWKLNILSPESTRREFGFMRADSDSDNDTYAQHIRPDEMQRMNQISFDALSNNKSGYHQEFALRTADGSPRHMSEYVRIKPTAPGEFFLVGVQVDITERKRTEESLHLAEEQLRHGEKVKAIGDFAAGMAHHLSHLVTVIKGYSKLLLRNSEQPDPRRKDIEMIQKVAERVDDLNQQLLAFGRVGEQTLVTQDINVLVNELCKLLRPLITEDIEFLKLLEPEAGKICANIAQIQQAVINLAINARQAMPHGGKLIFETRRVALNEETAHEFNLAAGEFVLLAISDTGCGMPREVQTQLFKPFFTTRGPAKGTGLGLASADAIIRHAGGAITVTSEAGKGTRVKIYLPLAKEAAVSAAPAED